MSFLYLLPIYLTLPCSPVYIPDDLKIAGVTPIFKGDRDGMSNYTLISILCIVAHVFERLLYNQLHDYLIDNKILYDNQWGSRSLHSTSLALTDCAGN